MTPSSQLSEGAEAPGVAQRVLVVGGTGGLGRHICRHLSDAGFEVIVASRSEPNDELTGTWISLDAGDPDSLQRAALQLGRVDHLVHAAAANHVGPIESLAWNSVATMIRTKVWGPIELARSLAIAPGGTITLISGAAANWTVAGRSTQRLTCSAVEALAIGLAQELGDIRVNAVSPGIIGDIGSSGATVGKGDHTSTVTGEQVAQAVEFCIRCGGVNGTTVLVDGGWSMRREAGVVR